MKRVIVLALSVGLLTSCAKAVPGSVPTSPNTRQPSSSPSPFPTPSPSAVHPWTPSPPPVNRVEPKPSPTPTTPGIPASLLGTQWYRLPTSQKVVALTFDAGANDDGIPSILSTLASTHTPATFFLTGKWVQAYPSYAAQVGVGYPVGNHSFDHPDFTTLSDAEVTEEVTTAASAIRSATGRDPRPLFRFPFGARNQHLIDELNGLGYGCIGWTVDTLGWEGTSGGQSADSVVQRVLDNLQPGEIVIMHVGSNPKDHSTLDADALPTIIAEIEARGYSFVTIAQYL